MRNTRGIRKGRALALGIGLALATLSTTQAREGNYFAKALPIAEECFRHNGKAGGIKWEYAEQPKKYGNIQVKKIAVMEDAAGKKQKQAKQASKQNLSVQGEKFAQNWQEKTGVMKFAQSGKEMEMAKSLGRMQEKAKSPAKGKAIGRGNKAEAKEKNKNFDIGEGEIEDGDEYLIKDEETPAKIVEKKVRKKIEKLTKKFIRRLRHYLGKQAA